MRARPKPFALLARVRRSLRVVNAAIESASRASGLTMQQQAFLLALAAHPAEAVPLSAVRAELRMDQATASELLARLARMRLVRSARGDDRRSVEIALTRSGRALLEASIDRTRDELQRAEQHGELAALRDSLEAYLDFYVARSRATPARATPRAPRRGAARGSAASARPSRRAGA